MAKDWAIVEPESVTAERFPESGVCHRKLTEELGCTEMRVNRVTLDPGEAVADHAHEDQEEVYISLTGGHVRIDGEVHTVPEGGIVRVGPEPIRSVRNESTQDVHVWVMIGAPPVGSVDDFGAYVMPDVEGV